MRGLRLLATALVMGLVMTSIFRNAPLFKGWTNAGGGAPISVKKHDETETRQVGMRDYSDGSKGPLEETSTQQVLTITSKQENVAVKKILLNRGHCNFFWADTPLATNKTDDGSAHPRVLNFGQTIEVYPLCNVIEASVDTDGGSFTFNFER